MQTPLHFETTTKLHSTSKTTSISAHKMHEKRKENNVLTNHSTHKTHENRKQNLCNHESQHTQNARLWSGSATLQRLKSKVKKSKPKANPLFQPAPHTLTRPEDVENSNPKAMALLTPHAHRLQSDHSTHTKILTLQTHTARTLGRCGGTGRSTRRREEQRRK